MLIYRQLVGRLMKKAILLLFCMYISGYTSLHAQQSADLYSPSVSSIFSRLAMETYRSDPQNPAAIERAMVLLEGP